MKIIIVFLCFLDIINIFFPDMFIEISVKMYELTPYLLAITLVLIAYLSYRLYYKKEDR